MKFVNLNSYQPQVGTILDCDIFVKASDIKMLLLFKKSTVFNEEDVARCKKYNETESIYIREEDYFAIYQKDVDDLKNSIQSASTPLNTKAGTEIARGFFRAEELLAGESKLDSMVYLANTFVADLLKSSKDQRSQALVEIFMGLANSPDIFVNHANQVAAISSMIALMTEGITLDNIVEINLVAVLHGMGLMVMSNKENSFFSNYADFGSFKQSIGKTDEHVLKKVIDKHFDGHNKLTTSDNVIFFQHLSLIEHNLDKIKIKNVKSQSLSKTLSDFKRILVAAYEVNSVESNPYISAKILAIGDRLVSLMNFYKKNTNIFECAVRDLQQLNNQDKPIFDKVIVEKVGKIAL